MPQSKFVFAGWRHSVNEHLTPVAGVGEGGMGSHYLQDDSAELCTTAPIWMIYNGFKYAHPQFLSDAWSQREVDIVQNQVRLRLGGALSLLSALHSAGFRRSLYAGRMALLTVSLHNGTPMLALERSLETENDICELHDGGMPSGGCEHVTALRALGYASYLTKHIHENMGRKRHRAAWWTVPEDTTLLDASRKHNANWHNVSNLLVGRSAASCQRRFCRLLTRTQPTLVTAPVTAPPQPVKRSVKRSGRRRKRLTDLAQTRDRAHLRRKQ